MIHQRPTYRPLNLLMVITFITILGIPTAMAQEKERINAAVLLPLHLDSLFKQSQYRYNNTIPRFALPYLEFYNGAVLAADSLSAEGIKANINIVDSKKWGSLRTAMMGSEVKNADIIIGLAQNAAELKMMADFAKSEKIPFVNATFPNDGGVRDNEHMLLVNTTLRTHCQELYKYMQSNYPLDNLLLLTRNGSIETYLKNWLDEAAKTTPLKPLDWKVVKLTDSFSVHQLKPWLDSTRNNTILAATMDGNFGQRLVKTLSPIATTYRSTVVGMPNWDELDFRKSGFKGVNVIFSTPFITQSANYDVFKSVSKKYETRQNSKPSDMALRGFELTYRFVKAVWNWPNDFAEHLNESSTKVFADFNFQPVTDPESGIVHYYENRKLYFVLKTDGLVKGVY